MRFPWISRLSHEEMVGELKLTISELKDERKVLYDRLALLGLGGPLFHIPIEPEQEPDTEPTEEELDAQKLLAMKHRPSQAAAFLTRKMQRPQRPSGVARVAQVNAALDQAEQLGKN